MTNQTAEGKQDHNSWPLPHPEESDKALPYFWARSRKPANQTIIFKLHHLSRRKIRLLLEVFVFITNVIATILEQWREDYRHPQDDGAIAAVFRVQDRGVYGRFRARALASIIGDGFGQVVKAQNTSLISSRLIEGAYRDAASKLVGWVQGVADVLLKGKPKDDVLDSTEFCNGWMELAEEYQRAMEIIVSLDFDPNHPPREKNERLVRKAKNEARRALERLRPLEEINQALTWVESLLADEPGATQRAAVTEEHTWMSDSRHRRAVRESWLMRRVLDHSGAHRVLGELHRSDLEILRDELYEMRAYIERAQLWIEAIGAPADSGGQAVADQDQDLAVESLIDPDLPAEPVVKRDGKLPAQKRPKGDETKLDRMLRDILETFLYGKPKGYPYVARVRISTTTLIDRVLGKHPDSDGKRLAEDQSDSPEQIYDRRMRWFQHKPERKDDAERFLSEQREAEEVQGMFRALRAMRLPWLHSIFFIGTTRPINYREGKRIEGQYRDGALLYEKQTVNGQERYRFVFAAILYERSSKTLGPEQYMVQEGRTKQLAWYKERRAGNPLWYVNFPETPFYLPEGTPVVFFPLECGRNYHERLLQTIIERQREAQQQAYEEINRHSDKPIPIGRCLPRATPIASARLTCSWTKKDEPEFHLHATVESEAAIQPCPSRIIGFSPYEGTYAYAVLGLDGTIEKVGDIIIPKYLDTKRKGKYSDNYVFWLANTMLAKAWAWEAYIAIEDASWMKQRPSTSHAENREVFSFPASRVATELANKTRQEGWMEPRLVDNVSPAYDCSDCRHRLKKGTRTLSNEWVVVCPEPTCRKLEHVDLSKPTHACGDCGYTWEPGEADIHLEQFFSCAKCYAPSRLVRHNRAIVVAQKGLVDLVEHYKNSKAKRECDQAVEDGR